MVLLLWLNKQLIQPLLAPASAPFVFLYFSFRFCSRG